LTRIKICGNTEPAGCQLAAQLGVELLGFVFAPSPRQVSARQARALIDDLPATIEKVGVFVDEPAAVINETVETCGLTSVQLHTRRTPQDVAQIHAPVIHVYHLQAAEDAERIAEPPGQRILVEPAVAGQVGGTGKTFDWTWAEALVRRLPTLVSGGLRPENVGAAVRLLHPYAVDVASGVEAAPGVKDLARLAWFVQVVRAAGGESSGAIRA
jgi:phosphoribosylanthranilate isomerase